MIIISGARMPITLQTKRVTAEPRTDFKLCSRCARACRSRALSGSTVPKSVLQKRHLTAIDLICSPQTGHDLESPQALIGSAAGALLLSRAGALSQPYVAQPPISSQHSL